MTDHYQQALKQIIDTGNYRRLPTPRQVELNFSSNDYLGLSHNRQVIEAAYQAGLSNGIGATGSRLLSGNYDLIEQLENQIARDKNCEAALVFATGFQANTSVLSALLSKQPSLVFFDKLNHASLYQAVQNTDCTLVRYRPCDLNHLRDLLQKYAHDSSPKWIIAETVFGMDGLTVPLNDLKNLAEQHGAWLYLDEAHATGLYGSRGYGLSTTVDLPEKTIIMGTFSKAIGVSGAYIACPQTIKSYLINYTPGFIYSTAPSPMVIGGVVKAWDLIPTLNQERQRIHRLSDYARQKLSDLTVLGTQTNIIPIIIGDPLRVMEIKDRLLANEISVSAIRFPTVPKHSDRLRLAITAHHTQDDIDRVVKELSQ
ncbi:MAG: 8-amino-7-oxononanoate synthase [Candidatus Paracaedibacteraceae bacterium]|nr:8-amino-7-oxononanoate synthase [Candidatus Paracaedibacteraceae bacterium]